MLTKLNIGIYVVYILKYIQIVCRNAEKNHVFLRLVIAERVFSIVLCVLLVVYLDTIFYPLKPRSYDAIFKICWKVSQMLEACFSFLLYTYADFEMQYHYFIFEKHFRRQYRILWGITCIFNTRKLIKNCRSTLKRKKLRTNKDDHKS